MGGRGAGSVLDRGGSGGSVDRVPRVAPINAKIFSNGKDVIVESHYDKRFIDFAHKNGGKWDDDRSVWHFSADRLKDVREAAKNIYGLRDVRGTKQIYMSFVGDSLDYYNIESHVIKHASGDSVTSWKNEPMLTRNDYVPESLFKTIKTRKDVFSSYSEALKAYEKIMRDYKKH